MALEDGTVLRGTSVGAEGESVGEVVFNTSLTGYQEVFTDASYNGQMVVMTNPLIGNYGVNPDDEESRVPTLRGVIVRELSRRPSNFRSSEPLGDYLARHGVVGIAGIDTRAVTKLLRVEGSLKGVISTSDEEDEALVERARSWEGLGGLDMVGEVSCEEAQVWEQGFSSPFSSCFKDNRPEERLGEGLEIVAFDFGVKYNILRIFHEMGFKVHQVPADTSAEQVRELDPDGVFLSNGPGDPEGLPYAIETIRSLMGDYPIFGICLGHQLTGLALGGATEKLKFGHHGGNHPVLNTMTGKVEISVQNHCYAVVPDSCETDQVEPYFINLHDQTLEGLYHKEIPLFTVQFHPEAAPGPNDFTFLFDDFARMIRSGKPLPEVPQIWEKPAEV
ncbi:MAG: glutamine-hydrolyzing carbamoyl-phosphate synthase small subunit [Planctomycetota bacterium]|nr:glutamine-hydrolyzing carbamoyl-phosphate synthase small subunit [Planctomycetota bacterium]